MQTIYHKIVQFIQIDIWRFRLKSLPNKKSFIIKQVRIILLAIRGLYEDQCLLRASALTFYSLLSIGPMAALALGIAKGFGFEKTLEIQLLSKFPTQEELLKRIIDYAYILLENTKGSMIAGIGIIILLWSVLKVLNHIEGSFNNIWEIKSRRALRRKFSNYLSFLFFVPILLLMSGSVPVFITTQIGSITEKITLISKFSPFIFFILNLLPYCLIWVLFTFIYILMPNTKVRFASGLVGGIAAGTIYIIAQSGYIYFQVTLAKHNAIYGSLAALPLFLIWIQASWLIVLIGAEISFAHQNVDTYEFEPDYLRISPYFKKLLSLQIIHLITVSFSKGKKPYTADQISQILEVPIRLVRQILHELVESHLLSDTIPENTNEVAYQPALDINKLSIKFVTDAMEQRGVNHIPVAQTEELASLTQMLKEIGEAVEKSPANKLIKDI